MVLRNHGTSKGILRTKFIKEGENCDIPDLKTLADLETLARTCMKLQSSKTLDGICPVKVGNPSLHVRTDTDTVDFKP